MTSPLTVVKFERSFAANRRLGVGRKERRILAATTALGFGVLAAGSIALVGGILTAPAAYAQSAGGAGGASGGGNPGGAGATVYGGAGVSKADGVGAGGGGPGLGLGGVGAGGGGSGGQGGLTFDTNGVLVAGPNNGANGADATTATGGGGGGGAGGSRHIFTTTGISGTFFLSQTGGAGGAGGAGGVGPGGGGGGAGGDGGVAEILGNPGVNLAIGGGLFVTGGAGGAGGAATGGGNSGAGGAGGIGAIISNSATFNVQAGALLSGGAGGAAGAVSGGGTAGAAGAGGVGAVLAGGGTLINSGAISGGMSADGVQADAISVTAGANTLILGGVPTFNGNIANNGTVLTLDQTGGSATLTAGITGAGAVKVLAGANTLTFSGPNTYTGATTVASGTLAGGAANTFSAASATTIAAGATLDLGGFAQTINSVALNGGTLKNGALTGAVSSSGGAIADLGGSASLTTTAGATTLTGANTYSGATNVNGGSLVGGAKNTFSAGSITSIAATATLDLGGFAQTINNVELNGGTLKNGSLTGAISSAGGTISGIGGTSTLTTTAGATTLTGANNFSGINNNATIINNGTTNDDLNNAGNYTNNGTQNADVATNSGSITNNGTWNGLLKPGANTGTTINNGTWNGDGNNAGGVITNASAWNGAIFNTTGLLTNSGTITLGVTNSGLVNNTGTISGGVTQNGGAGFNNNAGGVVNGGVVNNASNFNNKAGATVNGGATVNAGTVTNSNIWNGNGVITTAAGAIVNNLTWNGDIDNQGGTLTNINLAKIDGKVTNSGLVKNDGAITGAVIQNGGIFNNNGAAAVVSGALTNNAGTFNNNAGAKVKGLTTINGGAVTNAGELEGGVTINAGVLTTTNSVKGSIKNFGGKVDAAGTIAGGVTNSGTFNVTAALDNSAGDFTNNGAGLLNVIAGDYKNIATLSNNSTAAVGVTVAAGRTLEATTAINNAAGATITSAGTLTTATLMNEGTVNAQGKVNGDIVNQGAGRFNVTGGLVGDKTFNNTGSARLFVGGNSFTGLTTLTNSSTAAIGVQVNAGGTLGTLAMTEINNLAGATLATAGTINTTKLTNSGTVNASGNLNGPIFNKDKGKFNVVGKLVGNSSPFDNSDQAQLLVLTAGDYSGVTTLKNTSTANAGVTISLGGKVTTTGAITNAAGSFMTDNGTLTGPSVVNDGTFVLGPGATVVSPAMSNTKMLKAGIGSITGKLTNTGTVDITGSVYNMLTVGGYSGGAAPGPGAPGTGKLLVTADFIDTTTTRSGVLKILAGGATDASTQIVVNPISVGGYFGTPIPVVRGANGNFSLTVAGLPNTGVVSYSLIPCGPDLCIASQVNTGLLASLGGSIGSAITAATTGFFQNATAFVSSPPDPKPNELGAGLWIRTAAGDNKIGSSSVATTSVGTNYSQAQTKTSFTGYQIGYDVGFFNIENSGTNVHIGLMAGQYEAHSWDLLNSGTAMKVNVPFVGAYAVASSHGFFGDLQIRKDFWNTTVNNLQAGLNNTSLKGRGLAASGSLGYHYNITDELFVEPSVALAYNRVGLDNLPVLSSGNTSANLAIGPVKSLMFRGGARIGWSTVVGESVVLTPFLAGSIWRELSGPVNELFTQNASFVPISVSRVGTFGQYSAGVSGQVLGTGWTGFVRGDYRSGGNMSGKAINGGLRYQF